jgi:hypothetical protein
MDNIKIPDFELNKGDVYSDDYVENNEGKCALIEYSSDNYIKKYSVVTSYEELQKYLPKDDQVLHDTGRYILDYHKKGTYISIKDGKLKYFLFLNKKNFVAPYQNKIKIHPRNKYNKSSNFRLTNCLLRIINEKNEFKKIDFYVMEVFYFLKKLIEKRDVPDCNFYFNHKDQVLIHKVNNIIYSPFVDVFGNIPIEDDWKDCKLGRLFSMCHVKNYEDISFVAPDDIIRKYNLYKSQDGVCTNTYKHNLESENIKWEDKKPIAFFRGTSTGCGNDIYTNQRIKLAFLDSKWNADLGQDPSTSKQILDAKIVKWAYRLKKTEKDTMFDRINEKKLNEMGIKLGDKVSIDGLYNYKYVINVDGNVAAYRLGFLLSLNAVVFIVEGKYKLWFQDKLVENKHYISVKADLSNLKEKIYWCKNHDAECKEIAKNALQFHNETFTENNMFDYTLEMMNKMNKKYK